MWQQRTLPRLVAYKIIRATSLPDLENAVNAFLAYPENDFFACIGGADKLGHEEYIQTLHGYR